MQEHETKQSNNLKWKLLTLVSRGHCVVGAVFHIDSIDNAAEFDPYYIERIKDCLSLMVEKDLVRQLELEIMQKHTFRNAHNAQQYEARLKEMDEEEQGDQDE